MKVEWDARITRCEPNSLIEWRSEEESMIRCFGSVSFSPHNDMSTTILVRLYYEPPAGVLGHALLSILGQDPKHLIDDDLARLKMFLENGRPARDAARKPTPDIRLHH